MKPSSYSLFRPVLSSIRYLATATTLSLGIAAADTHTFSSTAAGPYPWAAGTGWSSVPASGQDTILSYTGTLGAGVNITSPNDITTVNPGNAFQLNQLSFSYAGPGTGSTAPTVILSGNPLQFLTSTTAAAPTISFSTSGSVRPVVTIQNALTFTDTVGISSNASTVGVISGIISGAGGLTKSGAGQVNLSGANTYTGTTTISDGTLQATAAAFTSNTFLALNGGVFQASGAQTFNRNLGTSGGTSFSHNGGGFSASGGLFTVNIGGSGAEVAFGNSVGTNLVGTLNFGSLTANNKTLFQNALDLNGGARTINVTGASANAGTDSAEISGVIRDTVGGGSLTKSGSGLLILSGTNIYSGNTSITGGVLQGGLGTGLSANSFLAISGNGILQSSGSFTRSLGTSGATSFSHNSGGFAANGAQLTVNIGGGSPLTWGTTVGTNLVGTLNFGSKTSTHLTLFQNAINLNGANRTISVDTLSTNNADSAEISGAISNSTGTAGLVKDGIGRLTLSGVNTFNGNITISGGALVAANAAALGGGTTIAATNGTLGLTGDITTGAGKTVSIGGSGYNSTGALQTFLGTNVWQGNVTLSSANARLGVGTGGTSLEVTGVIGGTSGNSLQVRTAAAAQVVKLGSLNTYAGATSIVNGVISFDSIKSVNGGVSSLGSPITIAAGTITLGVAADFSTNATLRYTGTGDTTDRVINLLSGTTGTNILTATLDQSGTGLLKYTSAFTTAGTSTNRNLVLTGSTAGTGEISGAIGTLSGLSKTGLGSWTLSGANTYTGTTTVSAGTLVLTGGSTGGSAITVANGATLNVRGSYTAGTATAGSLTVNGGSATKGTLSMADDAIGTLTLANTSATGILTVGGAAGNSSNLIFDLGGATAGVGVSDRITVNNFTVGAGGAVLNFNQITSAPIGAGTYTLVNFASSSGLGGLTLGSTPGSPSGKVATYTLFSTATAQQLIVALANISTTNRAYWTGTETSSAWNVINGTTGDTNFVENADGTGDHKILPDGTTDVFFAANAAGTNYSTTLGQDFSVRSLNFTGTGPAASNAYTIGGTNLLTIVGTGSTYGLTVDAVSADHVISTRVALGTSQTWNLLGTSAQKLTVSGAISGATSDLTVSGNRALILTGANTYRDTVIGSGSTVQVGAGAGSGSLGTGSVTNDGTLDFNRTGSTTLAGVIGGSGQVVYTTGTYTAALANTYTGATTVKNGATILVQNDAALGTIAAGTTVAKGGGIRLSGNVSVAENFALEPQVAGSGNDAVFLNTAGNNTLTGAITVNGDNSNNFRFEASVGSTLNVQGNVTGDGDFTSGIGMVTRGDGTINISGNLSGFSRLTVQGSNNTLNLSGANTFTGETIVAGNTTVIVKSINSTGAGAMASSSLGAPTALLGIIQLGSGATLRYTGTGESTNRGIDMTAGSGVTLDQSGTGTLNFTGAIRNTSVDTVKTLTLTGTGLGEISGTISDRNVTSNTVLTKNGLGTWTLSGAASKTYTGATNVNAGKLRVVGGGINSSTQINVTGATLELGNSDVIANTAALTLNNGVLVAGGATETLGTLALINDNQLDLVAAGNAVYFANSSAVVWSSTLAILNWTGTSTGGGAGDNKVFFGTDATGLTESQISKLSFVNPTLNGVTQTGNFGAMILSTGEVVAFIPEPSAMLLFVMGASGAALRRRRK